MVSVGPKTGTFTVKLSTFTPGNAFRQLVFASFWLCEQVGDKTALADGPLFSVLLGWIGLDFCEFIGVSLGFGCFK